MDREKYASYLREHYLEGAFIKLSAHELIAVIDYTRGATKKDIEDLIDKCIKRLEKIL